MASTGYLRQASAGRLIRLASAKPAEAVATATASEALAEIVEETVEAPSMDAMELHETSVTVETNPVGAAVEVLERQVKAPMSDDAQRIMEARIKGYEGDPCTTCGHMTLVRNGTCLKCDTCGSPTGCS